MWSCPSWADNIPDASTEPLPEEGLSSTDLAEEYACQYFDGETYLRMGATEQVTEAISAGTTIDAHSANCVEHGTEASWEDVPDASNALTMRDFHFCDACDLWFNNFTQWAEHDANEHQDEDEDEDLPTTTHNAWAA